MVLIYLIVWAIPLAVVALMVILVAGPRIPPLGAKSLAAAAFMAGPGYALWRLEWFDVWRHGIPPLSFILSAYGPYLAVFAAAGWIAAGKVSRTARTAS